MLALGFETLLQVKTPLVVGETQTQVLADSIAIAASACRPGLKWNGEKWKSDISGAVSKVKHRHSDLVANFQCASINKSTMYVTMHKRKAPINTLSRSKAPKRQLVAGYKHSSKTSGLFKVLNKPILCAWNNFANLCFFAKVSIPVKSLTPWYSILDITITIVVSFTIYIVLQYII